MRPSSQSDGVRSHYISPALVYWICATNKRDNLTGDELHWLFCSVLDKYVGWIKVRQFYVYGSVHR